MDKNRPVNLNLFTIKFPITAIISITHRISGLLLFLLLPWVLWVFNLSAVTESGFLSVKELLNNNFMFAFTLWVYASCVVYHLFAGVRHIFMDLHFIDSIKKGKCSAMITMAIAAAAILALAFMLLF